VEWSGAEKERESAAIPKKKKNNNNKFSLPLTPSLSFLPL